MINDKTIWTDRDRMRTWSPRFLKIKSRKLWFQDSIFVRKRLSWSEKITWGWNDDSCKHKLLDHDDLLSCIMIHKSYIVPSHDEKNTAQYIGTKTKDDLVRLLFDTLRVKFGCNRFRMWRVRRDILMLKRAEMTSLLLTCSISNVYWWHFRDA